MAATSPPFGHRRPFRVPASVSPNASVNQGPGRPGSRAARNRATEPITSPVHQSLTASRIRRAVIPCRR
jgi:hypothetical protein